MQEGVARQMGVNVTGLFLLAYLCDVLSVPLLSQVYRLPPLPPTSQEAIYGYRWVHMGIYIHIYL